MSPGAPSGNTSPRGDRRREAILAALDERLKTTALDDISVADLTEAVGITRSAFYFYFDSKAAAVSMLLVVVNKEAGEAIGMIVDGAEGDIRQRVRAGLARLVDRVIQLDHIYRALLTARTQHEQTREMWIAGRRFNAEPVAAFIRTEREAGRAPEGADAQALAEGLMQLNQLILERVVYEPDVPRDALLDITTDMWVRTIYGRIDPAIDTTPTAARP